MATTLERVRPEAEEIHELEQLWRAPAAAPPAERDARSIGAAVYPWLCRALLFGWAAILLAIAVATTASNPEAIVPVWVDVALTFFWISLMGAGVLAWMGWSSAALLGSAAAGAIGTGLGYACKATEHHTGSWWIAETAAFAALTAVSVACLVARRSRPTTST